MNFAHIHLILNHIPVVGIPVALLFLVYGFLKRNLEIQKCALWVLVGLALVTLPVYFTGDPAEKVIKHFPEVRKTFIEPHEEAAEFSLIVTLISGAVALVALLFQKEERKFRVLNVVVIAVSVLAMASLAYTASLGGEIRHTELRSDNVVQML
jgi:uncharacterized membrane protein